jgi:hypothetical protein
MRVRKKYSQCQSQAKEATGELIPKGNIAIALLLRKVTRMVLSVKKRQWKNLKTVSLFLIILSRATMFYFIVFHISSYFMSRNSFFDATCFEIFHRNV